MRVIKVPLMLEERPGSFTGNGPKTWTISKVASLQEIYLTKKVLSYLGTIILIESHLQYILILNLPTNNYKSYNNKRYQQKTTNLPTIELPNKYKGKATNLPLIKLQISQQKTTNLTTIKLSKIKPSTAQYCPLMTQYHQVPTITALY